MIKEYTAIQQAINLLSAAITEVFKETTGHSPAFDMLCNARHHLERNAKDVLRGE